MTKETQDDQIDRERALIRAAREQESGSRGSLSRPLSHAPSFDGYDVVRRLKGGGQGVVYQAVQMSTGRTVAIKVLRTGPFASENDRARIEREVRILGRLEHPGIVSVLDSGVTVPDQFFYVMDYVDGVPLDEFVRSSALDAAGTLSLMARVCETVSGAHIRGVIHRDLKPGNILVTPDGTPHVLDFGLAKIQREAEREAGETNAELTMTRTGQFLGSLPWSSPEQAQGDIDRLDTRTDVYALGVMMYQSLTGKFPYDVKGPTREVLSRIANDTPAPPSSISGSLNDEVDTIVLKCLSKERERRYQSSGEVARDLRRYLSGEPIEAKRDSAAYFFRKQIQKHRAGAAIAAGFVLLFVAGSVTSFVLWRQAETAQKTATEQAAVAQAVNSFLNEDLLKAVDPANARGKDVSVLEVLDKAAMSVGDKFTAQPAVEGAVRTTIGSAYRKLGKLNTAAVQLQRAVQVLERAGADSHPRRLLAMRELAVVYDDQGKSAEGVALLSPVLEVLERTQGALDPATLLAMDDLGQMHMKLNQFSLAQRWESAALAGYQRAGLANTRLGLLCANNLSYTYRVQGEYQEAQPLAEFALTGLRTVAGPDDPITLSATNSLGVILEKQDRFAEAEPLFRNCLELRTKVLTAQHHDTLVSMHNLGRLYLRTRRLADAAPLLQMAASEQRRLFPDDPTDTPAFARSYGDLLFASGDIQRAEPILREALAQHVQRLQTPHREIALSQASLAALYMQTGRREEARVLLTGSVSMLETLLGKAHPETIAARRLLEQASAPQQR